MLYSSETWTIGNEEQRKTEDFKMWCFRRTLKMSWMDRITNEEVGIEKNDGKRYICETIKKKNKE